MNNIKQSHELAFFVWQINHVNAYFVLALFFMQTTFSQDQECFSIAILSMETKYLLCLE